VVVVERTMSQSRWHFHDVEVSSEERSNTQRMKAVAWY
jgi:hypothetical protein